MNNAQDNATAIDIAELVKNMSVSDLAKLMAETRKAEKAKKEELASLPQFAFLVVMADSPQVVWTGKAVDYDTAKAMALDHAATQGEVFTGPDEVPAIVPRPLPKPRGRKVKAD